MPWGHWISSYLSAVPLANLMGQISTADNHCAAMGSARFHPVVVPVPRTVHRPTGSRGCMLGQRWLIEGLDLDSPC